MLRKLLHCRPYRCKLQTALQYLTLLIRGRWWWPAQDHGRSVNEACREPTSDSKRCNAQEEDNRAGHGRLYQRWCLAKQQNEADPELTQYNGSQEQYRVGKE